MVLARRAGQWWVVAVNAIGRRVLHFRRSTTFSDLPDSLGHSLEEIGSAALGPVGRATGHLRSHRSGTWRVTAVRDPGRLERIHVVLVPETDQTGRLALAMEAAGVGSWTWDIATNVSSVDERTRRIFGYPADAAPSQELWLSRVHPEDRERIRQQNARCLAGEQEWNVEYRIVRPDGTLRWVREATRREASTFLVGFVLDVTDEVEARDILRRANAAVMRRADDLSDVIESLSDIIVRAAPDTTRLYVNAAYERILGRSRGEVLGKRHLDDLSPERAKALRARLDLLTPEHRHHRSVSHQILRDGRVVWIEWHDLGVFDKSGTLVEIRSVGRDLTERVDTERRLVDSERRLSMALSGSGRGLWDWHIATRTLYLSAEAAAILGLPGEPCSLTGDPLPESLVDEAQRETLARSLEAVLEQTRERFALEVQARRLDGTAIWLELAGQVAERDDEGRPIRLLGLLGDVTARRDELARMAYLANHDPLTGLMNRAAFDAEGAALLARVRRLRNSAAVLMIDLDGFKQINDAFGHAAGDEVLRQAAERIRASLRAHDLIARIGGDEFVALLDGAGRRDQLKAIGQRTVETLSAPLDAGGAAVTVTASVGIAVTEDASMQFDQLTAAADRALYEAKRSGRNRCCVVELP